MSSSVKKAVILAAGKGSRMLPLTKTIPKPMLPLYDKPALHYLVDECFEAGIESICIVVGHCKEVIINYFNEDERITFVVQSSSLGGTANALFHARDFIDNEPFILMYADEVIASAKNPLSDLIDLHAQKKASVVLLEQSSPEFLKMYNSVSVTPIASSGLYRLTDILEKPIDHFPSMFTAIGRMVFNPDIFQYLSLDTEPVIKEFVLTDNIREYMQKNPVYGVELKGKRLDIGYKQGWMDAHWYIYQTKKE